MRSLWQDEGNFSAFFLDFAFRLVKLSELTEKRAECSYCKPQQQDCARAAFLLRAIKVVAGLFGQLRAGIGAKTYATEP